ncbi:MAG: sigma-70 family RNA polymerase sigma factor [Planctomycetota bacterium]
MQAKDFDPTRVANEALGLARERLGPHAEAYLSRPEVQVLVLARVRAGIELEDAVLAEVHRACEGNRRLADEFVAYFLTDLLRVGRRVRSQAMQRFLDTGDLVQSVLGDFWPDLLSVRFETRARFLSYLSQRITWKAADRARALRSARRQEDRRADVEPERLDVHSEDPTPDALAEHSDDREWLALALLRLPERDQALLKLYLQDASIAEIASALGLAYDTARIALKRAIRRARALSEHG